MEGGEKIAAGVKIDMREAGAGGAAERVRRVLRASAPALAIVAAQQLFFPMGDTPFAFWQNAGVLVEGLTLGLLNAVIALGMALVYRANRVLNFAQGDLGVVPVTFAVLLVHSFSWPWLGGLAVGLALAAVLGAVVELAVIRRFFRAPRLILTVATIGLSQLLVFVSLMLPRWIAHLTGRSETEVVTTSSRIEVPFDVRLEIPPIIFSAEYVVVWIAVPLLLAAVAVFLRKTLVGTAVRASADRADRASLLGVPVKRLHTYVWMVAAVLSFLGLYLKAGVTGLPFGGTLSFNVLLLALAALMLGRLVNLPTVVASAVALGLVEKGVSWNDEIDLFLVKLDARSALVVAPVVGVVIIVSLLLQRTGTTRAEQDETSSWQSTQDVRPIPRELTPVPEVRWVRAAVAVGSVAVLVVLPHLLGTSDTLKAAAVPVYGVIVLSIVVLTGWAGQISLGQMALVALGAALGAKAMGGWGVELPVAILLAGLGGSAAAVVVGLPALRLRGMYLAVTTLAFALATTQYLLNATFFDWVPVGSFEEPPLFGRWDISTPTRLYYTALVFFALALVATRGVRASRTGRVLIAMRENENAALAYGVAATRAKLSAFALSGFLAGSAGALLAFHQHDFGLGLYSADQNLVVFTAAVVGGLGSLVGAAFGALFLQGTRWFLPAEFQLFTTAAGVLVVLLVLPGGLGGLLFRARDLWLRSVAQRNGIVVPSLLADTKALEEQVEAVFSARARAMAAGAGDDAEASGQSDAGDRGVGAGTGGGRAASGEGRVGDVAAGEVVR